MEFISDVKWQINFIGIDHANSRVGLQRPSHYFIYILITKSKPYEKNHFRLSQRTLKMGMKVPEVLFTWLAFKSRVNYHVPIMRTFISGVTYVYPFRNLGPVYRSVKLS